MARADKESRLFLSTSAEVEACSGPSASKTGQILHLLARCRVFVSLIGTLGGCDCVVRSSGPFSGTMFKVMGLEIT